MHALIVLFGCWLLGVSFLLRRFDIL